MNQRNNTKTIDIVNPICCGLDVHKKVISATLIITDSKGNEEVITREFETFTDSLLELKDWLAKNQCPIVAMESTGIYWQPVHNILENTAAVMLVNARHVKNLPGKKTDIEDSKWLASLLKHGLLKGSFIPPKEVRNLREKTRLRQKMVQNQADYKRRIQKLLESANIKIDSVLSDLFGKSGRKLLELLLEKEANITMEDILPLLHKSVKAKRYELLRSIQGHFTKDHAFTLSLLLKTVDDFDQNINAIDKQIKTMVSEIEPLIKELKNVPGLSEISIHAILAEIGFSLEEFKNSSNLCSWAGLCPGNNQSAGKRKSGRSPVRNHPLKTILVEAAWAAIKKKGSYFKDKYYSLKSRTNPKKAIIAIAHKLLKVIYNIVKHGQEYKELGEDYLCRNNEKTKLKKLKAQASKLGMQLIPIGSKAA